MAGLARITGYVFYTIAIVVVVALGAELLVRTFSEVGRLGTERTLFVRDGEHFRHSPNASSVAFGVRVYTDQRGFRVGKGHQGRAPASQAILVLGDSVGFGVGVEYDRIATAHMDAALADVDVENAAVIGYSTRDYERVVEEIFSASSDRYVGVVLIYCLNDVSEYSARHIRETRVKRPAASPILAAGLIGDDSIASLKDNQTVKRLNDFLRAYSSAYVMLRGEMTQPRARHWRELLRTYKALPEAQIAQALAPIHRIAQRTRALGLSFRVWVVPYAHQMADAERLPQTRVGRYFRMHDIDYVDLLDDFRNAKQAEELFLPYDPVHLSARGHRLLAERVLEVAAD